MDTIIIMCIGIIVGRFLFTDRMKKGNEYISLTCTFLLIFAMGVMLGKKENFLQELSSLGLYSFLFFAIPTILSIIFVYMLTQRYLLNNKSNKKKELEK